MATCIYEDLRCQAVSAHGPAYDSSYCIFTDVVWGRGRGEQSVNVLNIASSLDLVSVSAWAGGAKTIMSSVLVNLFCVQVFTLPVPKVHTCIRYIQSTYMYLTLKAIRGWSKMN